MIDIHLYMMVQQRAIEEIRKNIDKVVKRKLAELPMKIVAETNDYELAQELIKVGNDNPKEIKRVLNNKGYEIIFHQPKPEIKFETTNDYRYVATLNLDEIKIILKKKAMEF